MRKAPDRTRRIDRFAGEAARLARREQRGGALAYAIGKRVDDWVLAGWPEGLRSVALFALGGYGRGDMAPYSDIDLLFLLGPDAGGEAREAAKRQVYRLWDGGFEVGYSVRTVRECIDVALSDTDTRTALLEARLLAGDPRVAGSFERDVRPRLLKSRLRKYIQEKLREREARHRQYGATPFLLEPHVKEGEGGLRDLQSAFWLARVALGTDGFRGLDRHMTRRDVIKLYAAWEFLLKVRIHLHLAAGRRNDVLDFQMQDAVAEALGYASKYGLRPAERLMRRYYLHAREVAERSRELIDRSVRAVFGRIGGPSRFFRTRLKGGFRIERGYLIWESGDFPDRPARLLEAFFLSTRHRAPFSDGLRRRIAGSLRLASGPLRRDPEAALWFRRILSGPEPSRTLRRMHDMGVLGRYLPEFGRLRALVVREPYHRYTVDEHSLNAVAALEALGRPAEKAPDWLRRAYGRLEAPELLLLAVLIHDVGKGEKHGGAHSRVDLASLLDRLGIRGHEADLVRFLVREHLLMSEFAQRRDPESPEVVDLFRRRVGSAQRLDALVLMTYADLTAVRPGFFSPWKGHLIRELYDRALRAFETGEAGPEAGPVRADRASEIETLVAAAGGEAAAFPERYLRVAAPGRIERDARLISLAKAGGFAFEVEREAGAPFVTLTCAGRDTPGLLSGVTQVLARARLNIVKAEAFTSGGEYAIDRFVLSNWDELYWEGLEERLSADFRKVLLDGVPCEAPARRSRPQAAAIRPEIRVDNESFSDQTLIDIFCADRQGLLSDIFRALHEAGLDVIWAGIETDGELASDALAVRKADDRALLAALAKLVDVF